MRASRAVRGISSSALTPAVSVSVVFPGTSASMRVLAAISVASSSRPVTSEEMRDRLLAWVQFYRCIAHAAQDLYDVVSRIV